jgi:hypothetical protein
MIPTAATISPTHTEFMAANIPGCGLNSKVKRSAYFFRWPRERDAITTIH